MYKEEADQQWKNFIDDIASVFSWRYEDKYQMYLSGVEGDQPLETRVNVSKELGNIFKKYDLLLPRGLHYSILATMTEQPKKAEVQS